MHLRVCGARESLCKAVICPVELIGCVASMVAIYLICGQSMCLSAAGVLSVRHLRLGVFATKNLH